MISTKPAIALIPADRLAIEGERYRLLTLSRIGILLRREEEPSGALFLTNGQITERMANGTLRPETPLPSPDH